MTGTALDAIRGLGETKPEYKEAKTILQSKFGGKRGQLHAYMEQLEAMPPLEDSGVKGFEKFAIRDGELGTLHGLLANKLGERQVESYSR